MKPEPIMMFNGDETVRLGADSTNEVTDGVIAAFYNEIQQSIQAEAGEQQHIVVVGDGQNIVASSFAPFKEDSYKCVDSTALINDLPNSIDVSTNGINQDSLIMIDDGVAVSLADDSLKNKSLDIPESWKIGLLESNGIVPHSAEPMVEPEKQSCQFWECPKCAALFHDKDTCELHVVKSHDFTCGLCSEPFQEKEELENHIIQHISEIPGHTIQMIVKPSEKASDTTVQQSMDLEEKQNTADSLTDKNMGSEISPEQQQGGDAQRDQESSEIMFVCTTCGLSYSSRQHLKEHEKTHMDEDSSFQPQAASTPALLPGSPAGSESNSKGPQQYSCEICNKSFFAKNPLLLHMSKRHGSTASSNFVCSECGQGFRYKPSLENHLVVQHHLKKKSYSCCLCTEVFTSAEELSSHRLVHQQMLECDFCGTKFKQGSDLMNHINTLHPNKKRFTCGECGKSFKAKNFLEVHVSEVHSQQGASNKCRFCLKSFMSSSALGTHIHTHHTSKQNKMYNCEICNSSYQSPKDLYQHMTEHIDETKHFSCRVCGKYFIKEESLNMHMKTHMTVSQHSSMDET